ncbi:hypothetical protein GCM10010988_14040 [Cnuibacter physcomitrellae]|nr:hypothetical protein GCM10010988_14040 [Cnuibacter physcomitrellae]
MTDPRTSGSMPQGNGWRIATIVLAIVVGLGIVVAAVGLVVVSLQGGSAAPTPAPTTATPTPSATPTPTPTPTPTSTPTAGGACTPEQLAVRASDPQGTAGSTVLQLVFSNTSSTTCTMSGYPQVMFVGDQNGTQIGAAAIPDPTVRVETLTLNPGDSAYSLLTIGEAGNYDGCTPTVVDGFRVYPPDASGALYLPDASYGACAESGIQQLRVGAVQQN